MKPTGVVAPARRSRVKAVLVTLLLVLAALAMLGYSKAAHILLGAEAYVYGYPLVIMDVTRANAAKLMGPQNLLLRVRKFPDARFKDVVRPNVDTLYTSAFIDMQQGPWVFEMAPNAQRYEGMPFLDAWTNVFASPGTRTNGSGGGRYLLAGRLWQGAVPAGLILLRAPTDLVWLIGRTQTNGAGDYPVVHALQDGVVLRSLADWQAGKQEAPPPPRAAAGVRNLEPPVRQMRAMDVSSFFARLARLMVDNPPAASDAAMLAKLARIGIQSGQAPAWNALDRWAVALGRWVADRSVARELGRRPTQRGWLTPPALLPNWLPVRAGEPFLLNARLYWPKAAALDGSWAMPAVARLDPS